MLACVLFFRVTTEVFGELTGSGEQVTGQCLRWVGFGMRCGRHERGSRGRNFQTIFHFSRSFTRCYQVVAGFLLLAVCPLEGQVVEAVQNWVVLFDGTNLDAWESIGGGLWSITQDRALLGLRDPRKPPTPVPWLNSLKAWLNRSRFRTHFRVVMNQAWLYTKEDFYEYDLHLEYWLPRGHNSGISIRDLTRARYTYGPEADLSRTPSQVAYEIQLNNHYPDSHPSGSIYGLVKARTGAQKDDDWNAMQIEVRRDHIRVYLNGVQVAEHPGVTGRPLYGPIGLQLHDEKTIVLFRNIRLRIVTPLTEDLRQKLSVPSENSKTN